MRIENSLIKQYFQVADDDIRFYPHSNVTEVTLTDSLDVLFDSKGIYLGSINLDEASSTIRYVYYENPTDVQAILIQTKKLIVDYLLDIVKILQVEN